MGSRLHVPLDKRLNGKSSSQQDKSMLQHYRAVYDDCFDERWKNANRIYAWVCNLRFPACQVG